jgi:selenocysteine-specific elongation factor
MQRIIIGTAGHVDHGKSKLVVALTGVDPDRLPEEKEREMTIDLGFVFLPINNQEQVAIIDVPGHERFLKTMIAGASSIRMVLLVVAADEGVMPQTVEHFDVLRLLGIESGIIVITKVDKVDNEYVTLVEEDIKKLTRGSFLERAPIFKVSNVTQQGIVELKTAIIKLCQKIEPLPHDGIFRCPIDRIFSMKGFGTIVAGTVISGRLKKTDAVEILPVGKTLRVRNLQVHNESVEEVFAGQRAAFNLPDISKSEVVRGYELCVRDYLKPVKIIDAKLTLLSNTKRPLKNNERVRFHKGTREVMARVTLLNKEKIEPGKDGFVRFRLEKPIVGERKERFLIRSYSPMRVIGGGHFLELYPRKKGGRFKKERVEYLNKLENIRNEDLAEITIMHAQRPIANERELMRLTNIPMEKIDFQMRKLKNDNVILRLKDNSIIHHAYLDDLKKQALHSIEEFIKKNPLKVAMGKGLLAKVLRIYHQPLLEKIIDELHKEGKIDIRADAVKLVGGGVKISADAQRLAERLEDFAIGKGFRPFKFKDVVNALTGETPGRIKNIFNYLLKNDKFIAITEDSYLHVQILKDAKARLMQHLNEKQTIRAIEYKDLLGVSRNVARDILDYFFNKGITVRAKGTHRLADTEAQK